MSEWFGALPKRWEAKRAFALFEEIVDSNVSLMTTSALQFRFGEIIKKRELVKDVAYLDSIRRYTVVNKDDIIVNGLNLNYDFVTQRVAIVNETGCITPAYISLRVRDNLNAMYYCYLLKAMDGQKVLNGLGTGIRLTLSFSEFKKTIFPLPPRDEQDQIVRYLDWKVSQINKLINAKRRQIALLEEQKRVVINSILTRNRKTWITCRLKDLCQLKTGSTPRNNEGINADGNGHNWITPCDFKTFQIIAVAQKSITDKIVKRDNIKLFPKNSILFIGIGTVGKFAIMQDEAYSNQQITAIIPKNIDNKFLLYVLLDKSNYIKGTANYTTLPIVNNTQLGKIEIPFPSEDEQNYVVSYLDEQCERIDKIMDKFNDEIALFVEYRTRLISDVVTGRLDVRCVAVPEYEAVENIEEDVDANEELEDRNER